MYDRVAIRTYRPEMFNGVYHIARAESRQLDEMMHVNETVCYLAISGRQVDTTHRADLPMVLNADLACILVAFIPIDKDLFNCALDVHGAASKLFEEGQGETPSSPVPGQMVVRYRRWKP